MHPNQAFRGISGGASECRNLAFARDRGFGTLMLNADAGPLASHIPFLLDQTGATLDLHLVRSNPILGLLDPPQPALIAVAGADGYISPDWYDLPDQVPTWNYVAVHLRGTLQRLPDDALPEMLARQSAAYEAQLAPKPPWTMDKMTPETVTRMMRMIVPCRMTLASVEGTWKLGQNKPDAARHAAADAVLRDGIGQNTAALSRLMHATDDPDSIESAT